MRIDKQKVKEYYKNAPDYVHDALSSNHTTGLINQIGRQHNLHVDQIGALGDEIMFVLVGLEPAKKFPENIERYTPLKGEEAFKAAQEINEQVFSQIRDLAKTVDGGTVTANTESVGHEDTESALDPTGIGELKTQLPESAFSKAPKKAATLPLDTDIADTETVEQPAAEAPTQPAAPSIEAARLSGETGLPKTEREIDKLVKEKLPPKQAPSDQATAEHASPSEKPADGIDPYREPIS